MRRVRAQGGAEMIGTLIDIALLGQNLRHQEVGFRMGGRLIQQSLELALGLLDLAALD